MKLPCFLLRILYLQLLHGSSLVHYELSSVYGVRQRFNFILSHVNIQFPQYRLLKRLDLPHGMILATLVEYFLYHMGKDLGL